MSPKFMTAWLIDRNLILSSWSMYDAWPTWTRDEAPAGPAVIASHCSLPWDICQKVLQSWQEKQKNGTVVRAALIGFRNYDFHWGIIK